MIRKLRRQFILVAMLSMFLVLFIILAVLNIANYISMTKRADTVIDLIAENNGHFPEVFLGQRIQFEDSDRPQPPEGSLPPESDEEGNPAVSGSIGKDAPGRTELREDDDDEDDDDGSGEVIEYERVEIVREEYEQRRIKPDGRGKLAERDMKDFSDETPYETRFFSVIYDPLDEEACRAYTGRIVSVKEDEALEYAEAVVKRFQKTAVFKGYYKNYRYGITPGENGERLVVFVDISKERNNFRNVFIYSLILSGIGLLAVFILVYFLSKRVFKPVEESVMKQKRFITDASHELKTPLTIISANVDVLEMESEENNWTKSIKHQVGRMTGLVEDMVTLARMDENNEIAKENFSFSNAVSETAELYLPVAEKNGQKLEIDVADGMNYIGEENRIRQMTGLLLDNATKYASAKDGAPVIKVTAKNRGKKLLLQVYNTTDQVEAGNQDVLFERFYRKDSSRNSQKGGSGIGLSIVKSIVEAHKGKINARSADGESILFEIIL